MEMENVIALTNFNVPLLMRDRFDVICHASGKTRTQVLVSLMEDYIITQGSLILERTEELLKIDQAINEYWGLTRFRGGPVAELRNAHIARENALNSDSRPLSFFVSDGVDDEW